VTRSPCYSKSIGVAYSDAVTHFHHLAAPNFKVIDPATTPRIKGGRDRGNEQRGRVEKETLVGCMHVSCTLEYCTSLTQHILQYQNGLTPYIAPHCRQARHRKVYKPDTVLYIPPQLLT